MKLERLIQENSKNHYKLLVLVGDEKSETEKLELIENYLTGQDWKIYDVEDIVLELLNEVDSEEHAFVIHDKIKEWIRSIENRIVLKNANILYSTDLSSPEPFKTFKYLMREAREAILILDGRVTSTNKITYSTPDKEDYTNFDISEVVCEEIKNIEL